MNVFNNDHVVEEECLRLISHFGIKQHVETGTAGGDTTEWLAKLPGESVVHTIEIVDEQYQRTSKRLASYPNITFHHGDSGKYLASLLETLPRQPTLFYLDAHWQEYWPLRDELIAIDRWGGENAIIVIDDFQVPNRSFHHDTWGGKPCGLDHIRDVLPADHILYFNDRSNRLLHGVPHGCVGKLYAIPVDVPSFYQVLDGVKYSTI
jgi:hypothetical protein